MEDMREIYEVSTPGVIRARPRESVACAMLVKGTRWRRNPCGSKFSLPASDYEDSSYMPGKSQGSRESGARKGERGREQ